MIGNSINSLAYPGNCSKGLFSFVHVDDVCQAIELCIEHSEKHPNQSLSSLYIIGPKSSSTVKYVIDLCCEQTGWPKPFFSIPLPIFKAAIRIVSPAINWIRWKLFGYQRASFLFAADTIGKCNRFVT